MLLAVTPKLRTGTRMGSTTVTVWRPESEIAGLFGALQQRYPTVPMGSYPFSEDGRYGLHLVLRSLDPEKLAAAERDLRADLIGHGFLPAR